MTFFLLISSVIVVVAAFAFFSRRAAPPRDEIVRLGARIEELGRALFHLAQQVDARLHEATLVAERGQERATQALGALSGQLGEQREMFARLVEFQRDIKRFQELLQPPKMRGGVGEQMLEQLLSDFLPEGEGIGQYQRQYGFRGGERVDFVLRLKDFLVPIDAKFAALPAYARLRAAESDEERGKAQREFRQAFKQHIDDVARKYIRPEEGTADFAFVYIPSESVYLAFLDDGALVDFSFDRRVIVVSPRTFFAYLRTVLIGLRGFAIEASAKELLASLGRLEGEFAAMGERFRVAGGHLRNALKMFEEAEKHLGRMAETVGQWAKRRSSAPS